MTSAIAAALKIRSTLVPMSNERVRTRICTPAGELEFQTYFVKRRARDRVTAMRFEGASEASPAPGLLDAIEKAEAIILCPSNPFISIDARFSPCSGIREALQRNRDRVAAISPIVGGTCAQRSRGENSEEYAAASSGGEKLRNSMWISPACL